MFRLLLFMPLVLFFRGLLIIVNSQRCSNLMKSAETISTCLRVLSDHYLNQSGYSIQSPPFHNWETLLLEKSLHLYLSLIPVMLDQGIHDKLIMMMKTSVRHYLIHASTCIHFLCYEFHSIHYLPAPTSPIMEILSKF